MEQQNLENQEQKQPLSNIEKISKVLLLITLGISAVSLILSIIAFITKLPVIATITAVIGFIGLIAGVVLIAISLKTADKYCPHCGAKVRRSRTFLDRTSKKIGNWNNNPNSNKTAFRFITCECRYKLTFDCGECDYYEERITKSNQNIKEYFDGGIENKRPLSNFDTGYPDNSKTADISPEERVKRNKKMLRAFLFSGLLMIAVFIVAAIAVSVVKPSDEATTPNDDSSFSDGGNPWWDDETGGGNNNDNSNENDNPTENNPTIVYEVDESEWINAFGYNKLSNVTLTNYCDNKVYAIMIVDDGYISVEEFDEYGNRTAYTEGAITNEDIEETMGLGLKNLYSYFTYNADIQSYEYNGCYVQFSNGVLTSITQMYEGAEYRLEYTNYGTSEVS